MLFLLKYDYKKKKSMEITLQWRLLIRNQKKNDCIKTEMNMNSIYIIKTKT